MPGSLETPQYPSPNVVWAAIPGIALGKAPLPAELWAGPWERT